MNVFSWDSLLPSLHSLLPSHLMWFREHLKKNAKVYDICYPCISYLLNTLTVHDVYRRHPHHAQLMTPSIQALLVNAKKKKKLKLKKCTLNGLMGWTTYTPTNLAYNSIGTRRHDTSGSFCARKEYDVYRRLINLCKVT